MALSSWDLLKVLSFHLHGLAILASLARLFYRKRTRRFWWDDFWAFIALLCDSLMMVVYAIRKAQESDILTLSVFRWITLVTFTSAIWAARLSIAISIVRLIPLGPGRHVAKAVAALFAAMWIGVLTQKLLFICGGQSVTVYIARCQMPKSTGILELCTDLTADLWLICSPAYLLWDMKLTQRRQIVIFSVFASNIFMSVASIVHSILIFKHNVLWTFFSAQLEVPISLLVCNLLVLVTWVYSRLFPNEEDEESTHHYSSGYLTPHIPHRPTIPNYGFTGSVLVLTEMSVSLFGTFDHSPSHPTLGSSRLRPRSRTLNSLDLNAPTRTKLIHSRLRSIHSCPAFIRHPPKSLAELDCKKGLYKNMMMNTIDTDMNTDFPSLALSSRTEEWDPMRCETHTMRERRELRQLYRERKRQEMGHPGTLGY